jgi:response regulator RpfG family c-di-GMP phosphodiesterase
MTEVGRMEKVWNEAEIEGSRILVVDDEENNLELMEALLEPLSFKVTTAMNGEEALEQASNDPPDLIILDVMMPVMDGFEACRKLKERAGTNFIPVVMVTALDSMEDRVRGIECGADDFLSKPVNRSELMARTRSLLHLKKTRERLEGAYHAINTINEVSRSLLRDFSNQEFDMGTVQSNLVSSLLREGDASSPTWLVSGMRGEGSSRLILFRAVAGKGVTVDTRIMDEAEPRGWFPERPAGSGAGRLLSRDETLSALAKLSLLELDSRAVGAGDAALVENGGLFFLAGGYGRRASRFELDALEHFALNTDYYQRIAGYIVETENALHYTISALARAAEANDEDTGQHILRVNKYAAIIASEMGLPAREVGVIGRSAQMHDVGKVHIHPDILRKPGKLSREEWEIMKTHCEAGARILGDHPHLRMAAEIASTHHERWDGTGYPRGLKGEEIPVSGRICIVADIYDALRSARSYKPAFSHDQTAKIILEGDGRTEPGHFDPRALEAFRRRQCDFEEIYAGMSD